MTFRRACLIPALLAALPLAGCSSPKSNVHVTSLQSKQQYTQSFGNGYARHNAAGDVDVVVTKEFRSAAFRQTTGERTTASAAAVPDAHAQSLRQVLHVRVLWQPMKGTKTDSPTATNATLTWYVIGEDGRQTRMIEYSGAAFVDVDRKGGQTILTVRNATLKPTGRVGDLNDPIGPARVDGQIVASNDEGRVKEVLGETRSTIGAAEASARLPSQKGASSRLPAD